MRLPPFAVRTLLVGCFVAAATGPTAVTAQVVREAQLGPLRVTAPVGYHLGVASDQGMIGVFQDSAPGGVAPDRNRRGFQLGLSMFARIQGRCASAAACHPFQRGGLACLAAPTTVLSARADSGLTAVVCHAPGDSIVAFFMGDTTRFSGFFDTFVVRTLRQPQ